MVLINFTLNLL